MTGRDMGGGNGTAFVVAGAFSAILVPLLNHLGLPPAAAWSGAAIGVPVLAWTIASLFPGGRAAACASLDANGESATPVPAGAVEPPPSTRVSTPPDSSSTPNGGPPSDSNDREQRSELELREMVAALRSSERIYRDLFENATDIVFTTDLSGHFLAGNKAVQRLLGYTVEEAKELTWEKLVAPYDMAKATQMYKRHARGEQHISFEFDAVAKNGEVRTFEIGSRAVYRKGRLAGFHGIARDVTERKQMQEALIAARRAAEEANQAKSRFLANMSHEIRTPLNGILGFISLIAKTDLTAQQREYLGPVEESAKHLRKIVDDVLDLSKIEAGHVSIENEVIDVAAILRATVGLLRPMADGKGLALNLDLEPRIPEALIGDETRIGQIVSNLVNNAIKFTRRGQVVVVANVRRVDARSATVAITVRDTGIGISARELERIFDPFHQLDGATNRRFGGAGLGLAITRHLVQAMGGGIDVSSVPGRYTSVTVELPLGVAAVSGGTSPVTAEAPPFSGMGLRMLVVDDNEINRRFLLTLLRQHGIEVVEADCGGAAVRACGTEQFDLILMDIHMADMDGVETADRIRKLDMFAAKRPPVLAVSADVIGDGQSRFVGAGFNGFLAKPVTERDLAAVFRRWFPERCAGPRAETPGTAGVLATLDAESGVALACGDVALWRDSLASLAKALPQQLDEIRQSCRDRNYDQAARSAHRLAGSAAYVAAARLEHAARATEQAARTPNGGAVDASLAELAAAAEGLLASIRDDCAPPTA